MDREKVIKGLNYCTHTDGIECPNCPYWQDDDCVEALNADVLALLKEQETVVRCKDCKHRPKKPDWETFEDGGDIEFPDGKCPCQCSSDRYYSWYPEDEWFCAEGEMATD